MRDEKAFQWLNESELSYDIWSKKYRVNNESFDEWLDRVSGKDPSVKKLIEEKKFLFGGRILAQRGVMTAKTSLSNCYVLPAPTDNIESIWDCAKQMARTYSYGGGCGTDLGKLAPRGASVNNAAKTTSGAVSFMDLFSITTGLIGQQGRRGALMLTMPITHPDIEEFVDIKKDLDRITKANISIRFNDNFFEAVKQNKDFTTSFTREATGEKIEKKINAKKFFEHFAHNAWDMAEPGALFWDRIQNYNLCSDIPEYRLESTNPCVTGDALVQTTEGPIPIRDLVGKCPYVYCMDEAGKLTIKQATKVWKTQENAELIEVDFNRGKVVCTPEHLIFTLNRGWVSAKDLLPKDKLNGLGFNKGNERDERIKLTTDPTYYKHHRFIAEKMGNEISGKDVHHIDGNHLNNVLSNLEVLNHGEHSKITNIGHSSYADRDMQTGRFEPKKVKAARTSNGDVNKEMMGKNFIVKNITRLSYTEDVYDMVVPETHNFIANNIVIHNCGEEPLPPGGACLLGSLNLSEFVGSDKFIKIDELKEAICIAIRGLNTVLDEGIERHPLPLQRQMARDWRQIGLGIFGLADMLIKMEVRYDSDEAIELCSCLAHIIAETAIMESNRLAIEYGAFPKCNNEAICNSEFIQNLELNPGKRESILTYGLRNSAILTIAPTGSLSTMFGVSGGIEPIFSNSYTRKTESLNGQDTYYKVYTPVVEQYMREHGVKEEAELPPYFVTAHDIDPLLRVKMQATWQECIDASISSTVNLKHDATPGDVFNVYLKAWELGCKGVTVYRDGCARTGILTTDSKAPEESPQPVKKLQRGDIIKCSDDMIGKKRKLMTGCGSLHCEAFFDPETGDLMETFFSKGSTGGCNSFMVGLSRMISLAARSGCDFDSIIDQLNSCITCPSYAVRKAVNKDTSPGNCCPAAIGKALKEMHDEMLSEIGEVVTEPKVTTKPETKDKPIMQPKDKCPECGEPLEHVGGCATCPNCGWSRCG